jgi:multiple sugar transport system substrate-binding protein
MGVDSSDSFYSFLTFMDAYNVKLVDDNGSRWSMIRQVGRA